VLAVNERNRFDGFGGLLQEFEQSVLHGFTAIHDVVYQDNVGVFKVFLIDGEGDGFTPWLVFVQFDFKANNPKRAILRNDVGK
jgi:hypothetical protein